MSTFSDAESIEALVYISIRRALLENWEEHGQYTITVAHIASEAAADAITATGHMIVDRATLISFIEMHIAKVDGEWGDCRSGSNMSLREENAELFAQFGLPINAGLTDTTKEPRQ